MTADLNVPLVADTTATRSLTGRPTPQLRDYLPLYEASRPDSVPPCLLSADDVAGAFVGTGGTELVINRLQRQSLQCVALEQIMRMSDQLTAIENQPIGERRGTHRESMNVALVEQAARKDIKAIARIARQCVLTQEGTMSQLLVHYGLEQLSVLPAHANRGYECVLAAGIAAMFCRELEFVAETVPPVTRLTIRVGFVSRVPESKGLMQHIIESRLRDELLAQDNTLQLDGKLARFLPLETISLN